jgi:hypothetical protein
MSVWTRPVVKLRRRWLLSVKWSRVRVGPPPRSTSSMIANTSTTPLLVVFLPMEASGGDGND